MTNPFTIDKLCPVNKAQTIWGWTDLSNDIDDAALYAFRSGGCAALAQQIQNLHPELQVVIGCSQGAFDYIKEVMDCDNPNRRELEYDLVDIYFDHAMLDTKKGFLDIGGFNNWKRVYSAEIVPLYLSDSIQQMVEICPPQDPRTVRHFAKLVSQKYLKAL